MPKTPHHMYNLIKTVYPPPKEIKHFYCKKCFIYIGTISPDNCKSCFSTSFHYFFKLDIAEKIKYLFKYRNLDEIMRNNKIQEDPVALCSIKDGSEYRRIENTIHEKVQITLK